MKTREQIKPITDFLDIKLISDVDNGEILDTKVVVSNPEICWIAGSEIENFANDFRTLIEKYSI